MAQTQTPLKPKQKFRKLCVCEKPIMSNQDYLILNGKPYHKSCDPRIKHIEEEKP